MKKKNGFTLLELMIVIVILGVLATLITGTFITSLKKGRDAKRKADLEQVQRALEFYYEDNLTYPLTLDLTSGGKLCHPDPDGCATKTYIQRLPKETKGNCKYVYIHETADGEGYGIYSILENTQDEGSGVKQGGYAEANCFDGGVVEDNSCICKFKIGSANYP